MTDHNEETFVNDKEVKEEETKTVEAGSQNAELAQLRAELEEKKGQLLRLQADFENYRRRMQRQSEELSDLIVHEHLKKLFPILDNLTRALAASDEKSPMRDGVEMTLRQFQTLLDKEGVTAIAAHGQSFDPEKHEALMQEPSEDVDEGTVLAELMTGYERKSKVLRPAMVKVATKP